MHVDTIDTMGIQYSLVNLVWIQYSLVNIVWGTVFTSEYCMDAVFTSEYCMGCSIHWWLWGYSIPWGGTLFTSK